MNRESVLLTAVICSVVTLGVAYGLAPGAHGDYELLRGGAGNFNCADEQTFSCSSIDCNGTFFFAATTEGLQVGCEANLPNSCSHPTLTG